MQSLSPEELVRWCQRTLPEDSRAFEALIARYKGRVYATTYRLMGNQHDAEDLAQEVFVKIYRGIRTLGDPSTLNTWIYRITTNACYDALDKRRRSPATDSLTPDDEWDNEPRYADNRMLTPEESALQRELRLCIEATLRELDDDGRAALVLRDVEGRSYQEIAEALVVGLSAIKMRIHRARLAFQRAFDRLCPGLRGKAEWSTRHAE